MTLFPPGKDVSVYKLCNGAILFPWELAAIYYTVIWPASYPISDLFGKGERKLSPLAALPCQISQISDKQLTKQLF